MYWSNIQTRIKKWLIGIIEKKINSEIFLYLFIGGLTGLIYFGFIALSVETLKLNYRFGFSIAYLMAVSFHFLANRKYTFTAVTGRLFPQMVRYSGVLMINYLITLGIVSFFVEKIGISPYFSAAISIVVTVGVGYLASKFWVFRNKKSLL